MAERLTVHACAGQHHCTGFTMRDNDKAVDFPAGGDPVRDLGKGIACRLEEMNLRAVIEAGCKDIELSDRRVHENQCAGILHAPDPLVFEEILEEYYKSKRLIFRSGCRCQIIEK